jgi:hypothetical protein
MHVFSAESGEYGVHGEDEGGGGINLSAVSAADDTQEVRLRRPSSNPRLA